MTQANSTQAGRRHAGSHRRRRSRRAPAGTGAYLPQPPTDAEKYRYFGRQQRWIFVVLVSAFVGVTYGMVRMALHSMWTSPLFVLVAVQVFAVGISLLSSTRRRRSDLAGHRALVGAYAPQRYPSVDVFLPSAGEDLAILDNTYRHVRALQWPGRKTVYVLDDSGRDAVRELADQYGFEYLHRPNRGVMKKAGNMAYGFVHSDGDFIHVFDADFAPRPDMTLELLPYFDDPTVGIVQSPQFFDVTEPSFNWLQRAAGATQELFYRWIQPARDAVDAAICVGTNAIYRRAALAATHGFAQIGHSEDVHTGVNLLKAGYRTRYVPVNLAKGVCPDDFDGFTNQQYRWCTGSMSLLADVEFHRSGLSGKQKLCFWTGFMYYITTALAVYTVQIPGLLIAWFYPAHIKPANYLPLLGTVLVWAVLMPAVTAGRWTPVVVRLQVLIGFCHALALFDFLRGRLAAWVPTGAAKRTPTAKRVLRAIRIWVALTQGLLVVGLARGIAVYGIDRYWASILFSLPVLYFTAPLLLGNATLRKRVDAAPAAALPGAAAEAPAPETAPERAFATAPERAFAAAPEPALAAAPQPGPETAVLAVPVGADAPADVPAPQPFAPFAPPQPGARVIPPQPRHEDSVHQAAAVRVASPWDGWGAIPVPRATAPAIGDELTRELPLLSGHDATIDLRSAQLAVAASMQGDPA